MRPLATTVLALATLLAPLAARADDGEGAAKAPPAKAAIAAGPVHPKRPTPPKAPSQIQAKAEAPAKANAPSPLAAAELEAVVRSALEGSAVKLPRGVTVTKVRALGPVTVPPGTTRTTLEMTPPARRAGTSTTTAILVFWRGDTLAARAPVTLELRGTPEAAPEVPKGTPVVLVVKREQFEITTAATTAADADVGEIVSVLLRPSGRSMRAQLATRDRAIAVEDPR